jgi:Flp pilus assembly protein TadG
MALEMFERVLKGSDIATGEEVVTSSYMTIGTAKSTYREGNATVQWSDLPAGATYNTTTNEPNPTTNLTSKRGLVSLREDGVQSGILSRMEKGKLVRMAKKGRSTMKSWLGM